MSQVTSYLRQLRNSGVSVTLTWLPTVWPSRCRCGYKKKHTGCIFFSLPFPSFLRPSLVRASAKKRCRRPRRQSFHLLLLRLRSVPHANAAQQCSSGTTGRFNVRIQQETLCSGSAAGVKCSHKGLSITVTPAATRENPKNVVTQWSKRAE